MTTTKPARLLWGMARNRWTASDGDRRWTAWHSTSGKCWWLDCSDGRESTQHMSLAHAQAHAEGET